jgi:D-serine dehydratase
MPTPFAIPLEECMTKSPLVAAIAQGRSVCWRNPQRAATAEALDGNPFREADVRDASERLDRFAPYLAEVFPETAPAGGIVESPLRTIPAMQARLATLWKHPFPGRLLLKMDSHLPVAGSIKARGGFHEVLALAEKLALENALVKPQDDYACLARPEAREFFSGYSLAVGSTGNLGLSVGLMGAALGFATTVHMSSEARQWKKDLLRSHGVTVVEYADDYGSAVTSGRLAASGDPRCHFVDDESSRDLFLGYAVAGQRLKRQLQAQGIPVDERNPLFVYLPCGVGGGPGGVTFGLKLAFGDAVSCFFAEPTHAPAVILGMATGLDNGISAKDLGLDGRTAADGLAVSRPSGLVCRAMRHVLDGAFTLPDADLFVLLHHLAQAQDIRLEPSALAGFPGVGHALRGAFGPLADPDRTTHVVWATGGSLVPAAQWDEYAALGVGHAAQGLCATAPYVEG